MHNVASSTAAALCCTFESHCRTTACGCAMADSKPQGAWPVVVKSLNMPTPTSQQLGSLAPYLNRNAIIVKDIDRDLSKHEVKSLLEQLCPSYAGMIVVPVDYVSGEILGCAYMNFFNELDGNKPCLRCSPSRTGNQCYHAYAVDTLQVLFMQHALTRVAMQSV